MTYDQLKLLARFYNVSVDYILYLTDISKPYPRSLLDRIEDAKKTNKKEVSI